jgi:SAM-dependent methyltransferase
VGEPPIDRLFSEPVLVDLYDACCPWGPDYDWYARLANGRRAVLDVACGTGMFLGELRRRGHLGMLCGLDASAAMLAMARRRCTDVDWVQGDGRAFDLGRRFELVTMTGHALQVLLTDDDVAALLACVHRHLLPGGCLAFETRNPLAREWARWTSSDVPQTVVDPKGAVIEVVRAVCAELPPDIVEFTNTYRSAAWDEPITSTSRLRFPALEQLLDLLDGSGFEVASVFGDWDGSPVWADSPELIVDAIAR